MLKFNSLYSLVFYELLVVGGVYLILTFYRVTFPKITFFMSLLVPPFHMAGVIAQLVALHMSSCSVVTGTCFWDKSVWEAGLWIPLFAGLIQIAAVLTLLTLMERRYFKRMRNPSIRDSAWIFDQNTRDNVMHESVSSEFSRIMKGCDDNVLFVKLWAHYPPEKTGKGNSEDPNAERQVKWAVRDLTLGVSKNETLSLLGKNGSGKTTSLSTLLGFQESTAGYAGIWPGKTVGFCPQVNALWDGLSGIDHIRFYASLRGCWAGRRYGEELLRSVGIDDFHKLTKSYSGGMKRRLCVAIAIVGSPDVLVMDEPTAGIDVGGKRHIWGILNSLRHRCSIIITTHSLEEADALSTRVSIMDSGRLVQIGTTVELKRSQRKMVVSFEPTLSDLALTTLRDSLAVPTQDVARTSESAVEVDLNRSKASEIISVCLNMKHEGLVREFSLHHLSLEDVYLRAVET
jgi:ABC-type multidrug transport system ATPase subunit